jgi:rhodanese-related sulfurtransferase
MKTIEAKELRRKMSDGLLLDVRTPAEHGEIHIPGSHLMPLHQLDEKKAAGLVPGGISTFTTKSSPVIFFTNVF